MPHIWVDADACPKVIKAMLFRAAQRASVSVTLVANQALSIPSSPLIKSVQVAGGFDVADHYIVDKVAAGDLVVTADIPLASDVIDKGAYVIGPRGEKLTKNNIKARLTMRNFMEEMRSAGQATGGPPPLNNQDKQAFGNALDSWLAKQK